jgi:hypothetical protein
MDFNQFFVWRNRTPSQGPPAKKPNLENTCSHMTETKPSWDIVRYALYDRPTGQATRRPCRLVEPYLSKQLPSLLKETPYDLKEINKIFAARWINDHQVILGSKCNKVNNIVFSWSYELSFFVLSNFVLELANFPAWIRFVSWWFQVCLKVIQ